MFLVNSRAIIERTLDRTVEIVVQTRNKPGESEQIELPGGRIEPYESLVTALSREVKEETGLDVVEIEGEDTRVENNRSLCIDATWNSCLLYWQDIERLGIDNEDRDNK